jgi:hypothetical protein
MQAAVILTSLTFDTRARRLRARAARLAPDLNVEQAGESCTPTTPAQPARSGAFSDPLLPNR